MNIEIFLSTKDNYKDYSQLLSDADKKAINLYFKEEINEMKNFDISTVVEEKNNTKILNSKSILKDDIFNILTDITEKTNRKDVYKELGNFLIIIIKDEDDTYLFLKDFTQNFVINKYKILSFNDSIKLINENSKNISLDWVLGFNINKDIIYVKSFKKLKKFLKTSIEEEHKKNFSHFINILKQKGIKLKKENSEDYIIDKVRKKDLSNIQEFSNYFSLEDLKNHKFVDSQDYLYKTKINEAIGYIVDKMYFSKRTKNWYLSDTHKKIKIDDGEH